MFVLNQKVVLVYLVHLFETDTGLYTCLTSFIFLSNYINKIEFLNVPRQLSHNLVGNELCFSYAQFNSISCI